MPNGFTPSSDLSSFYSGRMAPPIKLSNGQFIPAPNVMSVEDIYRGIYPPSVPTPPPGVSRVTAEGLNVYSRPAIQIGSDGMPVLPRTPATPPTLQVGMMGRGQPAPPYMAFSGSRPALTAGTQPAGTAQMPAGVRPGSVDRAFAQMGTSTTPPMNNGVWDPFGTSSRPKDEARLPTNAGEAEFLSAFGPQAPVSPAVQAATMQGGGFPPMPRVRPLPPAQIPLTAFTAPKGGGPSVPQVPGPITFKKGDTVGKLAKARGMSVSSFADLYGIANPNKIYAGQTVAPRAPVMPRTPTMAARQAPSPRETFDSVWSEARG